MPKFFTLLFFLLPVLLTAQNNSGMVNFQEKVNLHKTMGDQNPQLLEMIPEFQTSEKVLLFNPDVCLYRALSKEEKEQVVSKKTENTDVRMVLRTPDNAMYRDLKEKTSIEKKDFMGRTFLIEGEMPKKKWKITAEQENIAGFICMKAILDDTTNTVAWFTPQIPVSAGPASYGDLPGLILKVSVNDDTRVYEANKVDLKELEEGSFVAPSEGKKVSREKFTKIVEEKTKEMEEINGGSGTRIKIIRE